MKTEDEIGLDWRTWLREQCEKLGTPRDEQSPEIADIAISVGMSIDGMLPPADDDLPEEWAETAAWLQGLGATYHRALEQYSLGTECRILFWPMNNDGEWFVDIRAKGSMAKIPDPESKTAFRRLCQSLGIQLEESPCDAPA